MSSTVRLDIERQIATITNDRPAKHNAFDDAMDGELIDVLREIQERNDVRAVIWRGAGPSFSSGRDVAAVENLDAAMTHHELMRRNNESARLLLDLDVPIIVALHGWTIGVSFQRALLCDIRIAAEGTRFRLPETSYGLIPDTGGVARLFQMCGHGIAADLVLSGRIMDASEALGHGIVSRVVEPRALEAEAHGIAEQIVATPAITVSMARRVLGHLANSQAAASMDEEMIAQTFISRSQDFAEMRRSRAESRLPSYRNT